ncbi:integrase [Meiothermus sp. QL-1]|uniref:site-specific integrase n=1 Tax=Meiothermus sp. QL-1 TaxID=2058095 RepID=UPI000E0ACA65|nr:tyrosine-type recombinase/integrase [Meiothermus sp. QL-1]RDI94946.1 integrase [Meiothermus sp. QL-1]
MKLVLKTHWQEPTRRRLEAIRALQERNEAALLGLLEAYLINYSRKQAALSPRTLKNYRLALRDFLAWWWPPESPAPREPIQKSSRDTLARYVASLQTQGSHLEPHEPLSPGSIALRLVGVRQFYRALEWAGVLVAPSSPPAPRDPTPPEEKRPALPLPWYRRLLGYLEQKDDPASVRDRLAVRLAGECGLRVAELVGLRVEDVLLEERLLVVRGKGGKQRSVPLPRSLLPDLEAWLRLRRALAPAGEPHLLLRSLKNGRLGKRLSANGLWWRITQHYQAIGLPSRYSGLHMLRHTAGTRFYRTSRDLHATARLLGHASPSTSAIYAKMDLEGLFRVMDRLDEEGE